MSHEDDRLLASLASALRVIADTLERTKTRAPWVPRVPFTPIEESYSKPTFLRAPQCAKFLGVAESTLAKWRCMGGGPPFRKLSRVIVYDTAELNAWVAQHRMQKSTSDTQLNVDIAAGARGTTPRSPRSRRSNRE